MSAPRLPVLNVDVHHHVVQSGDNVLGKHCKVRAVLVERITGQRIREIANGKQLMTQLLLELFRGELESSLKDRGGVSGCKTCDRK